MNRKFLWAAPVVVALLLSACGSSTSGTASSAAPEAAASSAPAPSVAASAAASESAPDAVSAAAEYIASVSSPVEMVAAVGPDFTPKPGMTIGVMSCGQIATPCKRMADAAVEAVEAMGYKAIMTDGQLSPPGYTKAIMELVDKKVDLIIASVAAAATVPEAYKAAAAAGIPLVCLNCSNAALPSDLKAAANADADAIAQGNQMANYAISSSNGDVKAIVYTSTPTTSIKTRSDQAIKVLTECATCTVLDVKEIPLVPEQQQLIRDEVTSLLQKYGPGELNWIVGGADFPIVGALEAIKAAGRDDVKVVSVGCDPQNLEIIGAGGAQVQCSDDPLEWMGWASADLAGRILAGQTVTDVMLPSEFVTATVNFPPAGQTPVLPDFRATYKAQWGIS